MKITLAVAALLGSAQSARFLGKDARDISLTQESSDSSWVGKYEGTNIAGIGKDVSTLPHCPDFDERWTLNDGKTRGIPYPQTGYNCSPDYAISQKESTWVKGPDGKDIATIGADTGKMVMEHCPDFDERFTLADGKTRAIAYPQPGYNCSASYSATQFDNHDMGDVAVAVAGTERCPDESDKTDLLKDGKTRAIAYPKPHYNCRHHQDGVTLLPGALAQESWVKGYPQPDGKDIKTIGSDTGAFAMEHCPDFDERFTLDDGKTRAIAYPQPGYNCNPAYSAVQQDTTIPKVGRYIHINI